MHLTKTQMSDGRRFVNPFGMLNKSLASKFSESSARAPPQKGIRWKKVLQPTVVRIHSVLGGTCIGVFSAGLLLLSGVSMADTMPTIEVIAGRGSHQCSTYL
jgi:hypothetical protein